MVRMGNCTAARTHCKRIVVELGGATNLLLAAQCAVDTSGGLLFRLLEVPPAFHSGTAV